MSLCHYVLRPRRGLGQASRNLDALRLQALETQDLFHQHNRKGKTPGKIVIIKTSRYKGLVLGSFLAHETEMIFGDGAGASLVCCSQMFPAITCLGLPPVRKSREAFQKRAVLGQQLRLATLAKLHFLLVFPKFLNPQIALRPRSLLHCLGMQSLLFQDFVQFRAKFFQSS